MRTIVYLCVRTSVHTCGPGVTTCFIRPSRVNRMLSDTHSDRLEYVPHVLCDVLSSVVSPHTSVHLRAAASCVVTITWPAYFIYKKSIRLCVCAADSPVARLFALPMRKHAAQGPHCRVERTHKHTRTRSRLCCITDATLATKNAHGKIAVDKVSDSVTNDIEQRTHCPN